ncbi:hypothetical protein [Arcticibacter sp.]|uniref:hypothetical protein n=1 Tax=Arcticibacter sp. TaxID=1872630 RepID=UPI00388DB80A
MVRLKKHIQVGKRIALMLLVLFSLSPCSAKQRLLATLNIDYNNHLNKTRATAHLYNCSSNTVTSSKAEVARFFIELKKDQLYRNANLNMLDKLLHKSALERIARLGGSSPPKYILFKRLKIYLA